MYVRSIAVGAITAGLIVCVGAAPVHGETIDKSTFLTFSGPVKIPGVTLLAGTYRFHLTNPTTSRNVVQVLSRDGAVVYSQFHTIPDFRETPTYESTVTFKETKAGVPQAIHSLFYGGERWGYEFVYPRQEPVIAAQEPVEPRTPVATVAQATHQTAAPSQATEPVPTLHATPATPEAVPPQTAKKELPKTASAVPALTLAGLCSLLLAFGVHGLRRRLA